ncbi:MAG: thiosulfate oxidation carrier protein SoxY, partial [Pseudomonadota bacterium]
MHPIVYVTFLAILCQNQAIVVSGGCDMARHLALIAAGTLLVGGPLLAAEPVVNPLADSATWEDMRYDIVGDTEIQNGIAVLELDAPARAHDAATVPIVLRQIDEAAAVTKATVVVDENPAPVAA